MSEHEERRERMRKSLQLYIKIDRLQAAGDGLAEIARDFALTMKDNARFAMLQTTVDKLERYIAEVEAKLAAWNAAKEMK